jgi:DNA-binding CsgD family transcriptional regulator
MRPYGPLHGREDALATALGIIRRTHNHRASGVVLVSGNPGIGKTALVSEIARQAAQMRIRVARTKCEEIGPACPGAPVLGLLRSGRDPLIAAPDFEELTELTSNPLLLVDRTVGHLQAVAAAHRVLIAVDDVHWADGVSRYALRVLISRLAGFPVVWVLTSRSRAGGLAVGAADVVEVEHICLGPLTRSAVIDIARDRLRRKVISDEEGLLDAAGGNAFLATQIVEGIARRTQTGHDDDIPAEFRAAMRHRLAGLSTASRRLIEALAVAGRAVSIAELSGLCDLDPGPAYNDAVDAAVASGLVMSTSTGLAFIHDLVRQAMYDSMAPELRRRLHSRYAQHFLASSTDPAEAAAHAQAAVIVRDVPNVKVMVAAAEALVATSTAAAADLALHGFSMVRPGDASWLELGERAVAVLSTAQRANDTVVNRLRATVDDVDTVCRIETHAVRALWHAGHFNELLERAGRMLAVTGGRPDLIARFGAAQALAHTRILNAEVAAEQADIALAHARTTGDRDAVALGLHAAGEAAHALRRHQLALKHFRELRAVTGISYLAEEIMELQVLDRFNDAQMLLDAAYEDCHATAESLPPAVLFAQAKQHYLLGDLRDADQAAASVVELGQLIGTQVQVVEAIQIRVYVALLRGELTTAARRLSLIPSVLTDADAARHPGVMFCQGWLSAARGDTDRSLANWSQLLAEPGESRNYRAWWPCWLPVIFENGMACNATDLLECVLAIAEEGAARNPEVATLNGVAANLRGLYNNDLGTVAEAIEVLRDSPRRGMRAIASESYGQMLLQTGQRRMGLEQLDRAWDNYDYMGALARRAAVQRAMRRAGARRTKWSSDNSGSAARQLTEAERRVVHVIAEGHTDKSAAKLLGISENTVGTHIRSAYTKLGVQSRVQLANALRDLGELD